MQPTILLLHGALGHPDQFTELASLLQPHFDIHTLCFSGHGPQPLTEAGIGMAHLLEQLEQFISEKGLHQVHFFGYSLGGYVALLYALRHPESVASVLTLAVKMNWTTAAARKEQAMLQADVLQEKVPAYARQLATWHGADKWKNLLTATGEMMLQLGGQAPLSPERLGDLTVPVQMMVGDQDRMVSIQETRDAVQAVPGARLAVLPGCKHPLESAPLPLLLSLTRDFIK